MIVHLNGQLLPRHLAHIDPFDRGFIFGEGVYEGLRTVPTAGPSKSRIVGGTLHVQRLQRGLDAAGIAFDAGTLVGLTRELLQANGLVDAFVYWQITGGAPPVGDAVRSRVPSLATKPTVFGYCTPQPSIESIVEPPSKRASVQRDVRWELGWLKSISLMGNVHAAKLAALSGCDEAILVRSHSPTLAGGLVAEGLATNLLLVLPGSRSGIEVVTPSLESTPILAGVTREILLQLDPGIIQRPVKFEELERAQEMMFVGTTTMVTSITHVDGRRIGDGHPGPQAKRLLSLLLQAIRSGADDPE